MTLRSNELAALAVAIGDFITKCGHDNKEWHRLNIIVRKLTDGVAVDVIILTRFDDGKEIVVEQLIPIGMAVKE